MNIDTQSVFSDLGLTQQKAPAVKKELGADEFLKLMTTQMKNQDPLKPLDSSTFLGQLAQFSSVQGIQQLNTSVQSLVTSANADKALQGASLIGRSVLVTADSFRSGSGAGVAGEVDAPHAGSLSLEIVDASGAIVRRMTGSAEAAGPVNFAWDGMRDDGTEAPAGTYSIKSLISSGGNTEALQTSIAAPVSSVSLTASGPMLNLVGLDPISLSAVTRIY